jgi:hypothetical protein
MFALFVKASWTAIAQDPEIDRILSPGDWVYPFHGSLAVPWWREGQSDFCPRRRFQ